MKTLNKIILTAFTLVCVLFLTRIPALAANGTVSDLQASGSGTSVSVSGKTSGVTAAVFVQVLDADGKVIGSTSITVSSDAFSGTVDVATTLTAGTYTVKAADYDGGNWATATFKISSSSGGSSGGSSGSGNNGGGNGTPVTVTPLKTGGGDGSLKTGESNAPLIIFIVAMATLTAGAAAYILVKKRKSSKS